MSKLHPEKEKIVEKRRQELQSYRNSPKDRNDELAKYGWEKLIPPEATPKIPERLFQMTWLFLFVRKKEYYYITSDNPVFYFPNFGIGKEYSEVSFPISRDISLLAIGRSGIKDGFFPADKDIIKQLNWRMAYFSTQFLYSPYSEKWIKRLAQKPKTEFDLKLIL